MANSFWNFLTQLVPNTLAKAEDPNTSFSGIEAGFDLVEAQTLQSIKITNAPGVVNISSTPANRADKIVSFDGAGGVVASIYIGNYRGNHVAVAGTVYNVRDTVKDSTAALGQDNIYICNTTHTSTGDLLSDTANWDILLDAASAATSAAAALVSENNAAATYDLFDDRMLGAFAVEPTLDNGGNALVTGTQFFHTSTVNRMKVWNGTAWQLTTANAVDVNIADAGGLFDATDAEVALQEVMAASSGVNTTGTTSALVLTYGLPAPSADDIYTFTSTLNVLTAATLNIDAGGVKPIVNQDGVAIILGDIVSGGTYKVRANGVTNWILTNPSRGLSDISVGVIIELPPLTTGTSTAYTANLGITAYVAGTIYKVRPHTGSSVNPTIALDGLSVLNIKINQVFLPKGLEMQSSTVAELLYDGTDMLLLNPYVGDIGFNFSFTSGGGTVTIDTGFNTLAVLTDRYSDLCRLKGLLKVFSVSTPTGFLRLNLPTNLPAGLSLEGTGNACGSVVYNNVASSIAMGMDIIIEAGGVSYATFTIRTATGFSTNAALYMQAATELYIDLSYRLR